MHYVHSGCGIFKIHGTTYSVHPGEIFVIPPYVETYYEADEMHPWHYTWIGFTADIPLPEAFSGPVIRCSEADRIFSKMFRCEHFENGKSAYLNGCLWELIGILSEQMLKNEDYVEKAKSFIESNYMNDLTVKEIAEQLSITRNYLYSLFREKTGVSPKQYLVRVRLQKAAELMTVYGNEISISAQSVGYKDIYNFSKIFKTHFGVSPRAYRRAYASGTCTMEYRE